MAIASGAVITGVQELLDGTIIKLVQEISASEGISEEDAKDIVSKILLDLTVNSAGVGIVLKGRYGVRVAEYLGLTSRKFGPKALSVPAAVALERIKSDGGKNLVKRVLPTVLKVLAVPGALIWLTSALANIIEPGIYKPEQTNALYQKLGIPFQYPTQEKKNAPGPFSTDSSVTFADYFNSLKEAGAKGINNPIAFRSDLFTYDNLIDLVNAVYGQEVLKGNNLSVAKLIPIVSKYIVGTTSIPAVVTSSVATAVATTAPKVYTGIVSQGVLGKGLAFVPRPDDLIESIEELKTAAANNLAPFLESFLSKVVYEIKIVSSIITKDGFKQTGQVQQIKTGTTSSGAPKYKTVYNKFALLNLYVLTDKGVRSKISTIVLGPTNSSKLAVGVNELQDIQDKLPALVTTSNISDIKGLETAKPVTISTPPVVGGSSTIAPDTANIVTSATPVSSPATSTNMPGNNALTLSEWYQARGLSLPSVSNRAFLYESLGLGQQSYYSGTSEQNGKLLFKLKQGVANTPAGYYFITAEDEAPNNVYKVERIDGFLYYTFDAPKVARDTKNTKTEKPKEKGKKEVTVVRAFTALDGTYNTVYSDGTTTSVKIK
jgi:hypothetical protein